MQTDTKAGTKGGVREFSRKRRLMNQAGSIVKNPYNIMVVISVIFMVYLILIPLGQKMCIRDRARSLVKRRTQTIGIIMPDIMSPFYSELMVKASDAAHKRGYQVLLCNSFRELKAERDYLKLLAEHQVEGILIFPIGPRSTESMACLLYTSPFIHA